MLVGGYGTRLRPLTLTTPKQMLPVVGRPMIERVVGHLASHGVDEAVLSLGYRPDAFCDAYPDDVCAGARLVYAVEPEPLDTAGAIAFAADHAGVEESFIVVNGDVITDLDVGELCERHRRFGAEGTIHLTPVDEPSRFGVVPIDDSGRVEAFVEKPSPGEEPSNWINAGTYVLEPSVLDRIPRGRRSSIERETFPLMVEDGTLFGVRSDVYWADAGTPETYLKVQLDLIDGTRGVRAAPIAPNATIAADATVAHSVIESGCRIGSGAQVVDSAVLPNATIGDGAIVRRSIVGPGARIGERAVVGELTVVGDGVSVDDRVELTDVLVPEPE